MNSQLPTLRSAPPVSACPLVHPRASTAPSPITLPPVNAWVAARFTLPGIVAHQSALRGGERLPIRDFGDAPDF